MITKPGNTDLVEEPGGLARNARSVLTIAWRYDPAAIPPIAGTERGRPAEFDNAQFQSAEPILR